MTEPDACELLCLDLPRAEELRNRRFDARAIAAAAGRARALGHPTRLAVALALQAGGELCVCDLSWVCQRSNKLISHHVRQLRGAGLVTSRRDGKMVMCSLTAAGVALLEAVAGAAAEARA